MGKRQGGGRGGGRETLPPGQPAGRGVLLSAARRLCVSIPRYVPAHAGRGSSNQNCRSGPCPLRADIAPVVVPSLLRTQRLTNSLDLLKVRLNFVLPLVVQNWNCHNVM